MRMEVICCAISVRGVEDGMGFGSRLIVWPSVYCKGFDGDAG